MGLAATPAAAGRRVCLAAQGCEGGGNRGLRGRVEAHEPEG
jgi:hypothetical protein